MGTGQAAGPGGPWMSAAEVERESGLHRALVTRFVPPVETASGPLYNAHHLAVARFVKQLTEIQTPSEAIDVAVSDVIDRPATEFGGTLTPRFAVETSSGVRRRTAMIAGAAAAAALIVGGLVGTLVSGSRSGDSQPPEAAQPVQFTPTVPAAPEPVCAEWSSMLDSYNDRRRAWAKAADPSVPADRWPAHRRALTNEVIPVLEAEAADMRRLAEKAEDPFLAGLMTAQAVYEDEFVQRLPNYQPSDQRYWEAVISFSGGIRAMCARQ
ncbi:uncharacterized protein RMCN_0771 [Mycolicibacterium novocastrense]|uniref:Uncharacterized protein n=2 Tax=Mycolicibacterium novocastrense TaxID=59813 RepID=A0ABQ0KDL3_MYCNV|nr:uncharacterized protein RMCN_0771 [Mycolicibacterium novocastrense]